MMAMRVDMVKIADMLFGLIAVKKNVVQWAGDEEYV